MARDGIDIYKGVGTKVARFDQIQIALERAAKKIETNARVLATAEGDTGAFAESLKVEAVPGKKGVKDRLVTADDPAAVWIEFGHDAADGTPVEGKSFLRRAVRASG